MTDRDPLGASEVFDLVPAGKPVARWEVRVTHYREDGTVNSSVAAIRENEVGAMVLTIPMWSRVRISAGVLQRQIEATERLRDRRAGRG